MDKFQLTHRKLIYVLFLIMVKKCTFIRENIAQIALNYTDSFQFSLIFKLGKNLSDSRLYICMYVSYVSMHTFIYHDDTSQLY